MNDRELLLERSVGENLDALVSLDVRGYGVPRTLYTAARAASDGPLIMGAAGALQSRINPNDAVVVATGFVFPPWNKGELDGVVGATAIARALEIGFGAKPVLVAEPELVPGIRTLIQTAGLQPVDSAEALFSLPHTALVIGFTKDASAAQGEAERLIAELSPKAIISIERPGRDTEGVYHMGSATPCTDLAAKIDVLFEAVAASGGLTVAIGDLGNELGLGSLNEAVIAGIPFGDSIAAAVKAERVITAAVSDWAGYALAAAIAFKSNNETAFIPPVLLGQLLNKAVDVDLIDGSGYAIAAVDGVGLEYNMRLASMLQEVATMPHRTKERFARMFDMKIELDKANA